MNVQCNARVRFFLFSRSFFRRKKNLSSLFSSHSLSSFTRYHVFVFTLQITATYQSCADNGLWSLDVDDHTPSRYFRFIVCVCVCSFSFVAATFRNWFLLMPVPVLTVCVCDSLDLVLEMSCFQATSVSTNDWCVRINNRPTPSNQYIYINIYKWRNRAKCSCQMIHSVLMNLG